MTKVATYIKTNRTNKYREFLNKPFEFKDIPNLFIGWEMKDDNVFIKVFSNNSVKLNINSEHYQIDIGLHVYTSLNPLTINDFINDMDRNGIDLYWDEKALNNLKPIDYIISEEIGLYYKNLLDKMGKGFELNLENEKNEEG
jgi:hypothetical protein